MIGKINETVLQALQNYNPKFLEITIFNNTLSYKNETINLENFNLDTIFESYQLKLDLSNMNAEQLFKIIKINATLILSNQGDI